ncbi:hypothetical protein N8T08_011076 [Aspergillus melleus]|uniref:Uncharacterized protein n=1 Tax=Aspergillus melleus TaxID=138277 RepID=A0ACC3AQJ9_9EURO|nr:hypothetical protein N8T08_011076 [Aspergillus melleus]
MPMLIVARFLMGIAASVPSTVGGGIIADLMVVEERGTALTAWTIGNSLVFESTYGFDASNAGLAYVGLGVGSCLAQLTIASLSDRYIQLRKSLSKSVKPEHRLFTLVAGVIVLPIGLFWYGWTAHYKVHWIAPIIGTSFVGFGIMCVQLSVQLYLVDGFSYYAASAVAANLAIKCTFGTVIPLAGAPLYDTLGLGWGNSLLGFIAVGLIPASLLLMKYGDGIRVRGKFCGDSGDDT